MEMKALKNKLIDKTISDDPIIFKYSDNKFLCNQYIDEICKIRGLTKQYIESIEESIEDSMFDLEPETLYVVDKDKFEEYPDNSYKNLVVICKTLPDNLEIDYIDVTKVVNWQVEDYVKYRLQGLTEKEVEWLCKIAKYDIYRLDQECKKIELFPVGAQREIFREINSDNGYSDLSDLNIFNFTEAIIKKDLVAVGEMIPELEILDLEPLAVVTIMLKKFKQILALQTNTQSVIKTLGMSDKQIWFLKKNQTGIYTDGQLMKNIDFLTGIDYNIKSGNLDLNRENLLSYIVLNLLS